jgi:negative regulator of genetic competence, sporulation and motility
MSDLGTYQTDLFGTKDKRTEAKETPEEWQGMPEFVQEKKEEYRKIIVRFDNEKDVQAFAKAIGQNITPKTKSIWFPKKPVADFIMKWVDENDS